MRVRRYTDKKLRAVNFLGGQCAVCGYKKCNDAFDFHHINPSEKDARVSTLLKNGWENIEKELEKCTLLCANCHRETHWQWKQEGVNSEKEQREKEKENQLA